MSNISLMSILNGDSTGDPRIAKKILKVRQDKENILKAAASVNSKHLKEIEEGTKKRTLLLEQGKAKGLKEEDIFKGNELFFPTSATPILNMLYFITRDIDIELSTLTEKLNKEFGLLEHKDVLSENIQTPTKMEDMIYDNVSLDTFNKLKKLKTLSRGSNENESFQAFRKLNELCEKYNLDPDRIPLSVVRNDVD